MVIVGKNVLVLLILTINVSKIFGQIGVKTAQQSIYPNITEFRNSATNSSTTILNNITGNRTHFYDVVQYPQFASNKEKFVNTTLSHMASGVCVKEVPFRKFIFLDPGMDADQSLYYKLKDGYRMEKPENATQELYECMLHCWNINPESRPLFNALEKRLGKLLENGVAEHYIDLNEPYLQMNTDSFKEGQTDYLSFMGPPEGIAPSIPNYVNSHIKPNSEAVPDYLAMSPKQGSVVFNPRAEVSTPTSPTITNNLNHKSPKVRTKKPGLPEEMPMLSTSGPHRHSDSETETSPDFKSGAKEFTDLKSSGRDYKDETDNYVNVSPSTIINMNNSYNKDAVSNPLYTFGKL